MVSDKTVRHYLDITGLGEFLAQDGISEVIINKPCEIVIEGDNGWTFHKAPNATFENLQHLGTALTTYNNAGSLDAKNPIKSLVLPDGERSQIIIPPACEAGCISMTIRKPSLKRFTLRDYVESGRFKKIKRARKFDGELSESQKDMLSLYEKALDNTDLFEDFFRLGVQNRCNFLVVGGTGSGKTTYGKTIADEFPKDRRIITIEDVHEMPLPLHRNHVHLFYKEGGVKPRTLIESAMRMKPDHIFLAELRGDEAWSYLEALNTGHEGSITTIHANNCYASFERLKSLIKQSPVGLTIDMDLINYTVKTSLDIIVFMNHSYPTEVYFDPIEKMKLLSGV
ncbi:P-type DNA transfer ATPase VirB11 [Providencia huaxiensis]|uniref:P-type DNA transfer ATPase VirB11 n=1 Tax=Providencia huaxiensis TaxID=2027290 RepID=UPI000C7EDFF8|nr:P-type DNA transfer ATPase VirB11 [Providencia huaxiensis]AXH60557.1 P-type DNA transfer ATPase VirB11 [Providencia huaxiensis]